MSNSGFTFRRVRDEMIENLLEMGIKDFRVLDAMSQIPRHIFLDEALWSRAYENRSLTIGYKQTISQPFIVARMTELLISHTQDRGKIFENILEIGSGCGYQSAVLSYFTNQLYAIERIKPLVIKSRKNIEFLKIKNVIFKHGDGHIDWPEDIIFDGVLGAAAPRAFPQDLLKPLKDGGKVVFPVGDDKSQTLKVVIKNKDETEEQRYDAHHAPRTPQAVFEGDVRHGARAGALLSGSAGPSGRGPGRDAETLRLRGARQRIAPIRDRPEGARGIRRGSLSWRETDRRVLFALRALHEDAQRLGVRQDAQA